MNTKKQAQKQDIEKGLASKGSEVEWCDLDEEVIDAILFAASVICRLERWWWLVKNPSDPPLHSWW